MVKFDGLDAKVITKVGLQAGVAPNREVGGVTVLHDDKTGLAVSVETAGNCQELMRDTTIDPDLAIRGVLELCPTGTLRVEHFS